MNNDNVSFSAALIRQRQEEDRLIEEWALGDYISTPCPNCGRSRLCECNNDKHRCEKCNWVPEDKNYCEIAL